MFAVQGVYANGTVIINEPVPFNNKYDVVVTFLSPLEAAGKAADRERKLAALKRITGVISESALTPEEARAERLKRQ